MPSIEVVRTRLIEADPEQAFALSLDLEAFPALFRGKGLVPAVQRVVRLDSGPLQPGSRRRVESSDGNRVEEVVLQLDPPRRHRYRVTGFAAPFGWWVAAAEADWIWVPQPQGVQLSWHYRFDTRGGLGHHIASLIIRSHFAAAMQACLDALAAACANNAPLEAGTDA
jgi:hypothetical protein